MEDYHQNQLNPGLFIIHSNKLEILRQRAVNWVKTHPVQVLESECIIVPNRSMAEWLKLAVAGDQGCGISAGFQIQLPEDFIWTAYRSILGEKIVPVPTPYNKGLLMWRIFRLLPTLTNNSIYQPLNQYLENDKDLRKRNQLAKHLADLYHKYQIYRNDWLEDWSKGQDIIRKLKSEPEILSPEQRWQAELWRKIKNDIPESLRNTSLAELQAQFFQKISKLDHRNKTLSLPRRIILFGISSLPPQLMNIIHKISSKLCQVLIFVHNPSPHFLHTANPLLSTWGKQGRDYIDLLYKYDQSATYSNIFQNPSDQNSSLLQQAQQTIFDLDPLPFHSKDKLMFSQDDRSIEFHIAHSREREVEILQDRLLDCFERTKDLTPGDIMVMAPDINAYTPYIEAVFGNISTDDPRYIPFKIADKVDRTKLAILNVFEQLLTLPDSRMGVNDLANILDLEAFRNRFNFKKKDLPKLFQWIEESGIRWGFGPEHRKSFDLPEGLDKNTWNFGLNRMFLGYAVGRGEPWHEIYPYEEIGGLEADLVGNLSVLICELEKLRKNLIQPTSPAKWCDRIQHMIKKFFSPTKNQEKIILNSLIEIMDEWQETSFQSGLKEDLPFIVVRDFLLYRIRPSSMSQLSLMGKVNFGSLIPMQTIPFKIICLIGMNDGEFPRVHQAFDFDLMSRKDLYRTGDRSAREDDRYLFLETLLSARKKFYISYVGRDIRDNSEKIPSILIGQLQDYLNKNWSLSTHQKTGPKNNKIRRPIDQLTYIHPLQPFDCKYFSKLDAEMFSYAHEWRSSLKAAIEQSSDIPIQNNSTKGVVKLFNLIEFMKNPIKFFLNKRLGINFDDISIRSAKTKDQEPFALTMLSYFDPGMSLLEAVLSTSTQETEKEEKKILEKKVDNLNLTGALPTAGFGKLAAQELSLSITKMLNYHAQLHHQWPIVCEPLEISILLNLFVKENKESLLLNDWLNIRRGQSIDSNSSQFARWEFWPISLMNEKNQITRPHALISLWVTHIAACTQGVDLISYLAAPDGIAVIESINQSIAKTILDDMASCYLEGSYKALPVTAKAGLAYETSLLQQKDQVTAKKEAHKAYEGDGYKTFGELYQNLYLQRIFPEFESLWQANENQFIKLTKILYKPLAVHMKTI